jgi:hypothetical protein
MVTVQWHAAYQHLIIWTFEGDWTAADALGSFEDFRALVISYDHPYRVLIDFTNSEGVPPRLLNTFPRMASVLNELPRQGDKIAVVAQQQMLGTMARLFGQAYSRRMTLYTNYDSALAALQKDDLAETG